MATTQKVPFFIKTNFPSNKQKMVLVLLVVLIVGFAAAFILSFAMGANDVANSFGTSVGSKVLTLKQAVIVAAIFETLGSILVGYQVTDTVRKGIVDISIYDTQQRAIQLAFGALATLLSTCLWLFIATMRKLPVSASHAIVGATLGFTLVMHGADGVKWPVLGFIALSWIISPLLAGLVSALLFFIVQRFILRKPDPITPGLRALPIIYGATIFINVLAILLNGSKLLHLDNVPGWIAVLVSLSTAALIMAVVALWMVPYQRRRIQSDDADADANSTAVVADVVPEVLHLQPNEMPTTAFVPAKNVVENNNNSKETIQNGQISPSDTRKIILNDLQQKTKRVLENGHGKDDEIFLNDLATKEMAIQRDNKNGHGPTFPNGNTGSPPSQINGQNYTETLTSEEKNRLLAMSPTVQQSQSKEEKRKASLALSVSKDPPKTKRLFSFVQVLTACCASFAHGGNDVSNSIGPLVTIWLIYESGGISVQLETPLWILLFGGIGISIGLLTLGRRVIQTIGEDLTSTMTPSSGFCIELGTVTTVLLASKLGVPISTTHCIVGSVIAVGLLRSRHNVNMRLLRGIILAWVITLPATIAFSAAIMFAFKLTLPYF